MSTNRSAHESLASIRSGFHRELFARCIRLRPEGGPNMADKDSPQSVRLATAMVEAMGYPIVAGILKPQSVGSEFAYCVNEFLSPAFLRLRHLRPGEWEFSTAQGPSGIARFAQYAHLASIEDVLIKHPELRSSLGGDYLIKPDIVVSRKPLTDLQINSQGPFLSPTDGFARMTPLRQGNLSQSPAILHATVSVKWSMRSDRAQNTRTEALNVIRNRKGGTPKVVVVTMEPLPSRIASIAMGTGDIDCCYHASLIELLSGAKQIDHSGSEADILRMLVEGHRLRDISDLPFDLIA